MPTKITRPMQMERYKVKDKREYYRHNKSPSAKEQHENQKEPAMGMLFLSAVLFFAGQIILSATGLSKYKLRWNVRDNQ